MAKQRTNLKILALDQATGVTGYSFFKGDKYQTHGKIQVKIKDTMERSKEMFFSVCRIIDTFKPDVVYVEGVAMQSNIATLTVLARLQGMIIGYCDAKSIRPEIITPSEWRHLLGFKQGKSIKRPELKKQALEFVKDKYKVNATEDECESICIARAAAIIEGERHEIKD